MHPRFNFFLQLLPCAIRSSYDNTRYFSFLANIAHHIGVDFPQAHCINHLPATSISDVYTFIMTVRVRYMTSNYSYLSWYEHKVAVSTQPHEVHNFSQVAGTLLLLSKVQRKAGLGMTFELLLISTYGTQKKLTTIQQFNSCTIKMAQQEVR